MKKIIVAISVIALTFTGCSSKSGERTKGQKIVRVQEISYNGYSYFAIMGIQLKSMDTLYREGDTVSTKMGTFVIIP